MTWTALQPDLVCDVMDFWAAKPWPLQRDQALSLAVENLGWATELVEGEEALIMVGTGLSEPEVRVSATRDHVKVISLSTADKIDLQDMSALEALGDHYAYLVRHAATKWGRPRLSDRGLAQTATWDRPGEGRVTVSLGMRDVRARFVTPQSVAKRREWSSSGG